MPCGKTGLGQSPCDILMAWLGQLAISFSSDIAEFKGVRTGWHFRFSAEGADPSFGALLNDLDIQVTGVGEEFATLIHTGQRLTRAAGVFFG